MAKEFTSDFLITTPNEYKEKATLAISSTGDLIFVDGRQKLAEQILRAVVNEKTALKGMLNSPSITSRSLYSLFTVILREFKFAQISETSKADPNFSGFAIYRRAAQTTNNYSRVSSNTVVDSYVDTGLENGVAYNYGIAKIYKGVYETSFCDQYTVTPYKSTESQEILIGQYSCVIAGDRQASVYVDYNRNFKGSELIDTLVGIYIKNQADPRGYTIEINLTDMQGNKVGIAARRMQLQ